MRSLIAIGVVASALLPLVVQAGTTGGVTGNVVSFGNGAPIAGAEVTAWSAADVQITRSDAHGYYAFIALTPGTYEFTVKIDGFQVTTIGNVAVLADQVRPLTITVRSAVVAIVRTDGPFTFYGLGMGLGGGHIADVYTLSAYRTLPASAPPIVVLTFLRMTPGITFGAGAPMTH